MLADVCAKQEKHGAQHSGLWSTAACQLKQMYVKKCALRTQACAVMQLSECKETND